MIEHHATALTWLLTLAAIVITVTVYLRGLA